MRVAVILAGGSGERFWPLSSARRPKQLLRLVHPEQTLLDVAVARIATTFGREQIYVSTSAPLAESIRSESSAKVLAEPAKRNTLGALCWVVANLMAEFPDEKLTVAILTADHKIGDERAFLSTLNHALEAAEREGAIVTIGIRPTRPETGFGYVQLERPPSHNEAQRAVQFCEKPTADVAETFVREGNYLWNSGMFFFTTDAFARELSSAQPEAHALTVAITKALHEGGLEAASAMFEGLPNVSFDYAVMEKARNVLVVPAEFDWDDVGAWDALDRAFEQDAEGNVKVGEIAAVDAEGCVLVNRSGHKVGVLGVKDLVVVVSEDGVLVCPKDRAQEVRKISTLFPE